jgi:hypothetical protein
LSRKGFARAVCFESVRAMSEKHASTSLYVRALPGLRLRDKRVERLARKVRNAMPWLEPADFPAVRAWAELEYLSGQVYATLRAMGVINRDSEPRRLLSEFRQLRQAQLAFARELGMTPAARIAIKATGTRAPFDLPSAMIDDVIEIGESRARDRVAKTKGEDDEV